MKTHLTLLGTLFMFSTVSAQAMTHRVIPASHEKLEGNSLSTYPLKYQDVRWQMVIDKSAIAKTQAFLSGMSFRPDGSGTTKFYPSKKLALTIVLYEVATTPKSMVKTWKTNIGTAKGTVVFKKTLVLPAFTVTYPLPAGFSVKIPFSSLYTYKTAKGNLLIDWQETGTYSSVFWNADGMSYNTRVPSGLVNKIWENKACMNRRSDQAYLSISTSGNGVLGGSILAKYTMKPSTGSKLDLMLLGLGSSNRLWGATKLPLDLTPAGFNACALAVNLPILIPGLKSPISFSIPSSKAFSGLPIYFQGVAVDTTAALFVLTYNAYQVVLRPNVLPTGMAQTVYATKPSTRNGIGFMSPYFYFPVLRLDGKLFQ